MSDDFIYIFLKNRLIFGFKMKETISLQSWEPLDCFDTTVISCVDQLLWEYINSNCNCKKYGKYLPCYNVKLTFFSCCLATIKTN